MAPKPPDQKRKRGRPSGASKPTQDASSRERPEDNDNDAEEESRPQKRGRKALKDGAAANPNVKKLDAIAQPAKRGRPSKSKPQVPEVAVESVVETQRENAAKSNSVQAKTKAPEAHADEEPPSSELRRSGRERRSYNPEEMYSAKRPNHSPTQFTSPPSDSSRMFPPPRSTKKTEKDSPPRRSGRERRARDADKFSSSRQSVEQQENSSPVTQKTKSKAKGETVTNAPREAASPKRQRLKETVQNTEKRRSRMPQNESPEHGPSRPKNKRKTQAREDPEITTAEPGRRGRPKQSDQPSKSRKGPSQAQVPAISNRKPAQPRRETDVDEEGNLESEEDEDELPFRHLKEITRDIQRSTISDKWTPLDPPSINAVSNFLADAQRPVLLRLQNTNQRRGHASSALGVVIRRLRSRLVKGVPFPTPTAGASTRSNTFSHVDDFDFERVVDAMQTLENTLNPLLHSVSLLEREINKEEGALARDYDTLHHLETNAKAEAKEWRDKTKREHVLAPGLKRKGEQKTESRDRLELVPVVEDGASGGLFKNLQDEELVTLSMQIGSHMESMKGNLQPIDGVLPAITKSRAALQQVLLQHLDEEQYESVLLG